jgi:hypothetical protein
MTEGRLLTYEEIEAIDLGEKTYSRDLVLDLIFTLRESQSARIGWMEQALGGNDVVHGLMGQLEDAYKEIWKHWITFDLLGCYCLFCGEQQFADKKSHKTGCVVLCVPPQIKEE